MKVLLITSTLDEKSGWGRHSRAIADSLSARGMQIEIFSEKSGEIRYPVHLLRALRSLTSLYTVVSNIRAIRRVAHSVDVIHALDGWPYGVYGYLAVRGMGKKLYINGVGTYSVAPLYTLLKGFLLKRAYRAADAIFCISEYTKKELGEAGISSGKLKVVHFGVPSLRQPAFEESKLYRAQYDVSPDAFPVIATVGAIKSRKGQLDTLKAVHILRAAFPHILYIAAGAHNSKTYENRMADYAQSSGLTENLRIIDGADDAVIAWIYSACTVFALNSRTDPETHHFEGFGAVITEAYQFGKPAVGSSNSGIEDAIQDGKTGYLTKQQNPQDIAEKIEKILQDYDSFSANAKKKYADFDWAKTAATYIDFYKKPL